MAIVTARTEALHEALRGLGIDPTTTRKVVVEIGFDGPVKVHVQQYGDDRLLGVVKAIGDDVEVVRGEVPAGPDNEEKE
jgi:topoisomerase IA-like protein